MHIHELTDQADWQKIHSQFSPQLFIQAWEYAKFFQQQEGGAFFLGIEKDGQLVGGSLVGIIRARRGSFYYLPYGPLIKKTDRTEGLKLIREHLKRRTQTDKVNFIRLSPFWQDTEENKNTLQTNGFRPAPLHILAETSWILELDQEPAELLKNMRQNHRNLIRRADRDGVVIKKSKKIDDLKTLHNLLKITADRHEFVPYSLKYMENEFKAMQPDHAQIYEAHYQDVILGSAVIYFYGDTAVYRHSGSLSDEKYRKIPANYAIQWKVIQDAHQQGLKRYNFWGIAPEDAPKSHPFKGITRFKTGFGGKQIDLVHCHDYPLNGKYWLNWAIETYRKIRRGF